MSEELTKKQQKELKELIDEINIEAEKVIKDYAENPSEMSGSVVHVHENSPFLDSDDNGEPMWSGSRWTKVIRNE